MEDQIQPLLRVLGPEHMFDASSEVQLRMDRSERRKLRRM